MKKINFETIWLILILCIAFVLRAWNLWDAEFGYDELSAQLRVAKYPHWQDQLEHGIAADGHPAGLQLIIWVWVKLFGFTPLAFKLLMAMCSTASVYFIFRAGKSAVSVPTGLTAAALLAVSFLPAFWGQQVRPYAPGMLVCAALLWIFCRIVFEKKSGHREFILFGILAALAAYLHYFAGLFAFILGMFAWVFAEKNARLKMLLGALLAVLLFLPHLGITLHQLSVKGLGWLGKPTPAFISEHLLLAFNNSRLPLLAILIAFSAAAYILTKNKTWTAFPYRAFIIFLLLFALPLAIGYAYSIKVAPVLQHTVLLFSLPALFLAIGCWISFIPGFRLHLFLGAICLIGMLSLEQKEDYFSKQFEQPYVLSIKECQWHANKYGADSIDFLIDGENDVLDYYLKKYNTANLHFYRFQGKPDSVIMDVLINNQFSHKKPYLILCAKSSTNEHFLALLQHYFGEPRPQLDWIHGQFFAYSNTRGYPVDYTKLDIENPINLKLTTGTNKNSYLVFTACHECAKNSRFEIQTAIKSGKGKLLDWRSTSIAESNKRFGNSRWTGPFMHVVKLADIPGLDDSCTLSVNLQPAKGDSCKLNCLQYRMMKGNPYMYGVH